MPRAFTKTEQSKLLENLYIVHASSKVVKFDKKVLHQISITRNSIPNMRNLLNQFNIFKIILRNKRI